MKSQKSVYIIVAISLFVGMLHLLIGPDYNGICRDFLRGYLIDILLPANVYLLLQLVLRKKYSLVACRLSGALITFLIGVTVETLQFFKIEFLGSTFDPLDFLMYGTGVFIGLLIDYLVIEKIENI